MEGGEGVKCYCLEGDSFSFLTACVFVTRDTVRHPRRFVLMENLFVNRIVHDPRRS